jgi:superkiller protein 3
LKKTFIPYLLFLIILITGIYRLDHLAEEYSDEPRYIVVKQGRQSYIGQSFWEYQDEVRQSPDNLPAWKQDSLFIRAVNAYEDRNWSEAENYFSILLRTYNNRLAIMNYLGLTLYKSGKLEQAADVFESALQRDTAYAAAYINLGIVLTKQHKYIQAEAAYRKAIDYESNNPKPYLNLGILFIRQERWQEARPMLVESIRLSSGDLKARAQYYTGLNSAALGDTIEAKNYFNEAILLRPDYLLPRIQLGLLETDTDRKKRHLEEILRLNPNYAPAYYYLSLINSEEKNLEAAEENLYKAIKSNPSDPELKASLGELYLEMNRIVEAERIFSDMIESSALLPQNYFYLAKVESEKGNLDEAVRFYDLAITTADGYYPDALLHKGFILLQLDRTKEAADAYKEAIRLRPDYSEAHYNLGLLFHRDEDYRQALRHYRRAVFVEPSYAKAWYNAGVVFRSKGEPDSARYYFEQALTYKPDYVKALLNLGVEHSDLQEFDKAISMYRKLLSYYPNYTPALFNLGLAYRKNGQDKEAQRAYEKLLEYDPENIGALKNLGVLYGNEGNHELAIQLYEDGIDRAVHDPELRFNLAIQFLETDNYLDAVAQLNKAIQLDPDYRKAYEKLLEITAEFGTKKNILAARSLFYERYITNPDSAYVLAREWHREDMFSQAIEWYKKTIEYGKDDDWSYYWMGRAYHESANLEKARVFYNAALDEDPEHKFSHLRLAEIFEKQSENEQAIFHYRKVLEIDPDYDRNERILEKLKLLKDPES